VSRPNSASKGYRFHLHSSNEPGELSLWLCHDDSAINIVLDIIIIIIIDSDRQYFGSQISISY